MQNPLKVGGRGELVSSGRTCSSYTRTSYDMDFVLDSTKTQINKSLKIPKGLSESVNRRRTDITG